MHLDPAEVPCLPLPAALLERSGALVAATPEWRGAAPGSTAYHAGEGRLLVAPEGGGQPALQELALRLLEELQAAGRGQPADQARCSAVLAGSLQLVAGGPPGPDGTALEVVDHARAAIGARVPQVRLEVTLSAPDQPAPSPPQLALALVQLAVNAVRHEGADRLRLRVGAGPTFHLEWPSAAATAADASGRRHPRRRSRWGLGYVRLVADALGATALPPGPVEPGWVGSCLSLGSRRLTLPVAVYREGTRLRASQAWEQELGGAGAEAAEEL